MLIAPDLHALKVYGFRVRGLELLEQLPLPGIELGIPATKVQMERIEEGGCAEGARPECVSDKAKKRQRREMGTLGSGNHYLKAVYGDSAGNGTGYELVDYAALYRRREESKAEQVYFYEFEAGDGTGLTVETWIHSSGKESFQVFLSRVVAPDDIEVLSCP